MAWRNIAVVIKNPYITQSTVIDCDAFVSSPSIENIIINEGEALPNTTVETTALIGDDTNRIEYRTRSQSTRFDIWGGQIYLNNSQVGSFSANAFSSSPFAVSLVALVNDDTQQGIIRFLAKKTTWGFFSGSSTGTDAQQSALYTILTGNPLVTYNWVSVQAITGKNGASLALTQIGSSYIDEGEPVSGAAADCFDGLLRSNRVATLIDAALPEPEVGGTTVTVHYVIEAASSGSYTYCKLVAKRNKIPNSIEDGDKVIDIDPAQNKVTVRNLRSLTKYYFVIFIKDSNNVEGISDPESITTGQNHDIILFTDEFNTEILKSGWALDVYKSMFSSGSTGWAPTSFASDFLSSYNFLCGNGSRRQLSMSNGELWTANETGMTDQTFWIPIERTYINESIIVSFDGKISPIGWSSSYYNYVRIWLAYVDDNNTWHSYDACGDIVTDQQWHNFEHEIQPQFPYIDYIGLCCCDGSSHWKNIKVKNT